MHGDVVLVLISIFNLAAWSLKLRLTTTDLALLPGKTGLPIFMESLDYERTECLDALPRLLADPFLSLQSHYDGADLELTQQRAIFERFIHETELHPLLLSFAFISGSVYLAERLTLESETLEDYDPGIIELGPDNVNYFSQDVTLKILGRLSTDPWRCGSVVVSRMALLYFPGSFELNSDLETRVPATDSIFRALARVVSKSRLEDARYPDNPDGDILTLKELLLQKDYDALLRRVRQATERMDQSRQALWHGLLLTHWLRHFFLKDDEVTQAAVAEYLRSYDVRLIPRYVLFLAFPKRRRLVSDETLFEKLELLYTLHPQLPFIGGTPRIQWLKWRHSVRDKAILSVQFPSMALTWSDFFQWWRDYSPPEVEDLVRVDDRLQPPIRIICDDGIKEYSSMVLLLRDLQKEVIARSLTFSELFAILSRASLTHYFLVGRHEIDEF